MFVPPVKSQASPTALELGQRIINTIQEFQAGHPGTSATDIQSALRIAETNTAAVSRRKIIKILLLGLFVFGMFVALFYRRNPDFADGAVPLFPAAIAVLVLVILGVVVFTRR
ncbi:hypothetical protein ACFL6M_07490 [Candidatus Eisenbacteria bacterium]|uniref:DUF2335 domain-containing protein n=1 Tax=Eiseniibacteriota bacterium TaxID=2212470 RepID=A0ABV6YM59_UNCEI